MNTLTRFEPISDMDRLHNLFDRIWTEGPSLWSATSRAQDMVLPIDVYEKDSVFFVRAAIPGVNPDEIQISIEKDVLTLKGEVKFNQDLSDAKVYRREYAYGAFTRSIRLPENLDLDKTDAQFEHGLVTISIPRIPEEPAKTVKVRVKETSKS